MGNHQICNGKKRVSKHFKLKQNNCPEHFLFHSALELCWWWFCCCCGGDGDGGGGDSGGDSGSGDC